jgi:hypothetical protein
MGNILAEEGIRLPDLLKDYGCARTGINTWAGPMMNVTTVSASDLSRRSSWTPKKLRKTRKIQSREIPHYQYPTTLTRIRLALLQSNPENRAKSAVSNPRQK